jgi:hypothetical protein
MFITSWTFMNVQEYSWTSSSKFINQRNLRSSSEFCICSWTELVHEHFLIRNCSWTFMN